MSKRDNYNMHFSSDIFNMDPNNNKKEIYETLKTRKIHPITENTKEDLFNIGKSQRIKRNIIKNKDIMSKSMEKKHKNRGESDIFFQKTSNSCEKRKGVKLIPNNINKKTFLYETRNVDDYKNYLKNYQSSHRDNNNSYNPETYINKINPQERYFKAYYDDNISINKEGNNKKKDEQLKKFIHDRKFLKKEITKLNDSICERKENLSQDKRNIKYRRNKSEEKRFFADTNYFPKYNCRINQQIQMESNIFDNEEIQDKNYFEDAKEIYNRLEKIKKKENNNNRTSQINKNNLSTKSKIYANNINSDLVQYYNNTISNTGRMKDLYNMNNNRNYDLITGKQNLMNKTDIKSIKENKDNKKIEEMIESIPNLSECNKLEIRMKASVLDFNNENDLAQKTKELKDFYKNKNNQIRKKNELTLKIGEKNNNLIFNDDNLDKKPSEKYIMTYTSKSKFEQFDSGEIKNIFVKKGVHAYDIHDNKKNTYNGKNLNVVSFKLKGQDNEKILSVENDIKKEKYKIKIKKEDKLKTSINEQINKIHEEKRFKIMPSKMLQRKGFINQYKK